MSSTGAGWAVKLDTMRAAPTMSFSAGNTFRAQHAGTLTAGSSIAAESESGHGTMIMLTVSSGLTAGRAGVLIHNNTACQVKADAEL